MQKFYLAIILFAGLKILSAQETSTLWQKDIPSGTQDFLSTMSVTLDGQIMIAGSSIRSRDPQVSSGGSSINNGYDYHVLKLGQRGNRLWDKWFGGSRHDYLVATTTTREGGFLLAGTSYSNKSGDKKNHNDGGSDVWMIRLDENGEELWQKTLGTKSNDEASAVVQTVDEGFLLAGNIQHHQKLYGSKDVFVSKLNKDGELKQTTVIGGNGLDEVQEMIATEDGGAVLIIYSRSGITEKVILNNAEESTSGDHSKLANPADKRAEQNQPLSLLSISTSKNREQPAIQAFAKSEENYGEGDYWIVKLDRNARVEWQKTYGGSGDDRPKSIVSTQNGYLIGGESRSHFSGNKRAPIEEGTDLWLISLDKEGNEQWQKGYSFGNRDVLMSLDVIRKTNKDNYSEDKGFLIGGYTQAEERIKTDDEKFWMLYIDTSGKEQWRKHVEGKSRKKEERLVSAKLQHDGTFLLAGTSAEQLGEENWKILKLGDKDLDQLIEKKDITIYPNPAEDYCYVSIGFDFREAEITLYDMTGKQIQTLKTQNKVTKLNTANLPQGVYMITANADGKVLNTKMVKK